MASVTPTYEPEHQARINARAEELFAQHWHQTCRATDHVFAVLIVLQWVFGIVAAFFISPLTWYGATAALHIHVWAAVLLGAAITSLPLFFVTLAPGSIATRHIVAIAQMLWSSLLIHLLGGRIEAHFHVFGSLAFLAFYRDWRVLLTATTVVVLDHAIRGYAWPQSVYGVSEAALWRTVEHALWVLFEVAFLAYSIHRSKWEMHRLAERQAILEHLQQEASQLASERTIALREAHSQLQAMHDALPLGMFLTNSGGRTVRINPALERLMRFNPEESMGLSWQKLVHPDDYPRFDAIRRKALAEGRPFISEHRFLYPDGTVLWIRLNAAPIKHDGQLLGYVGTVEDVTERRRQEDEIRRAKEEAEAASVAKSMFLANMSHEIRTPMNAILGFVEVLRDQEQTPQNKDALRIIQVNGEHLLEIISDILDLSKIEAGKIELEHVEWPLAKLVSELVSMQAARAAQAGLKFEVEVHGPVPRWINTDPVRLRQILLNLISNSIKFTKVGGIKLVVRFFADHPPQGWEYLPAGPYVMFQVIDSGIGMSEAQCNRLFQPFTQADNTTTRRFGGTGLGLAICRRVVDLLGGDIRVRSQPNVGSEFTVVLPTGTVTEVPLDPTLDLLFDNDGHGTVGTAARRLEVESEDSDSVFDAPLPGELRPMHVLLVEDGEDNRRLLTHFLNSEGATVTVACNGQEAVDFIAAGNHYSVILMDMQMPILDGYSATRQLRGMGVVTPIIALTAHAMAGDREKCLQAGCDDYLTKPVRRHELSDMLDKHYRLAGTVSRASLSSVIVKQTLDDQSSSANSSQ